MGLITWVITFVYIFSIQGVFAKAPIQYEKREIDIPMRDGIKLRTHVYIPKVEGRTFAFLMNRTPYSISPYGSKSQKNHLGPSQFFQDYGFIFVYQDVRGRFMSEGDYINMRPYSETTTNENTDTYDTVAWLLTHIENNNGRVGLWGISYPGFYVSMGLINSHPAIKAASPQAPIADWFWDDTHHNGAFSLQLAFTFLSSFGQKREHLTQTWPESFSFPTDDKYKFFKDMGPLSQVNKLYFHGEIPFWNKLTDHPNYDEFWKQRNILPHLKKIHSQVLTVGGLYDAEDLYGVISTYQAIEHQNPDIQNSLVMGPWSHGAWARSSGESLGDTDFGAPTSEFYRQYIEFPFFLTHLYGEKNINLPEAMVFETGQNTWRQFDHWPPNNTTTTRFYFHEDGSLSDTKAFSKGDFVRFTSNPKDPVPNTKTNEARWGRKFMAEDQRFLDDRDDVLRFQTNTLEKDTTIAGPLMAHLWVSTNRSAADWVVKLIDVYPNEKGDGDGKKLLIRWEMMRGRFRNDFSNPEPFHSKTITEVDMKLLDVLHTFKKGHRILVQVQSSFFPFFDMNPQVYVDNIFKADKKDFKKARHKVYVNSQFPSHIEFSTLDHSSLTPLSITKPTELVNQEETQGKYEPKHGQGP